MELYNIWKNEISYQKNGVKKSITLNKDEVAVTTLEQHALVGVTNCKVLVFTKGPRGGKNYETDTFRLNKPLHK